MNIIFQGMTTLFHLSVIRFRPLIRFTCSVHDTCTNRWLHHIVTYLQNTYFEKNGFENFQKLIHLVYLIEMCFETNMLLKI